MLKYGPEALDYFNLCREAKKIPADWSGKKIKIALLADFASQQLAVVLKALFFKSGIYADIFEAEFNSIDHSLYSDDSRLSLFLPEFVLILETTQATRFKYYAVQEDTEAFVSRQATQTEARWKQLKHRCPNAIIFQSNFALPYERPFGNYGSRVQNTFLSATQRLNQELVKLAVLQSNVFVLDIDSIASYFGKKSWFDERLWALYKYPCALEYLPRIAQAIVDAALALKGAGIKCIVVDLDNTLWGGVIGDDGLDGIKLGHGDEGEAFLFFQHYLLELKKRGVLLAVCSKNELECARLPFLKHPEMVLRENDFAMFAANWDEKPANIRLIQETLNIGFDSILFLDDSAFERDYVRRSLPEVVVPEMPEDPADYVKTLSELNLFETASHTATDASRTQLYQEEFHRTQCKKKFDNYDEYLQSLDMKITIERFSPARLARIVQLMQRSNQFNLTTRRYSEAQCEAFMKDEEGCFPLCATLKDRFGDYGLISCVVILWKGPQVVIDEWLMSCRVLFRGVEQCVMNMIFEQAKQKGIRQVIGQYIPSEKNKMVENFYRDFGFKAPKRSEDGVGLWTLDVADYAPRKIWMEIEANCLTRSV